MGKKELRQKRENDVSEEKGERESLCRSENIEDGRGERELHRRE